MAKKTRAEIKEDLKAAKEELKVAKTEKRDFEKSSKLAKDTDHSGDAKHGKRWTKLNDMVVKKTTQVENLQKAVDEAKPETTVRPSKYDYPADVVSALDKKKYRTAQRAAAKKKAKAEADPKKEKKAKAEDATETTGTEAKIKKSKKEKKAKAED
jgi:hypothetical protein